MRLSDRRVVLALALGAAVILAVVLVRTSTPVGAPAADAGPVPCTSSGGTIVTDPPGTAGIRYDTVTFTASGVFAPGQPVIADVVVDADGRRSDESGVAFAVDTPISVPAGGSVVIRYPHFCHNPSAPEDVRLVGSTLTWHEPGYLPPGQQVTSYVVTYRPTEDTASLGSTFAVGPGRSIDVTGLTGQACAVANPDWACDLGAGPLVSGQSYTFRVFARTPTTPGQLSDEVVRVA